MFYIPHNLLTEIPGTDNSIEVTLYQRDLRTLHGNVRTGSHSNPNIGLFKGRRIVNAVAGHRYNMALALKFLDFGKLILRQTVCLIAVQFQLIRHRFSCKGIVPGKHMNVNAHFLKGFDGFGRRLFYCIRNAYDPFHPAAEQEEHDRLPGQLPGFNLFLLFRIKGGPKVFHQPFISQTDLLPFVQGSHTLARYRFKIIRLHEFNVSFPGSFDNSFRDGMFAVQINRSCKLQDFVHGLVAERYDLIKARFALGQGTRFIDDQHIHFFHLLYGRSIFDEHS